MEIAISSSPSIMGYAVVVFENGKRLFSFCAHDNLHDLANRLYAEYGREDFVEYVKLRYIREVTYIGE